MRLEEALAKHERDRALSDYEHGYVDALSAYSWHKDGARYVGTTGKLLGDAVDEFLTKNAWRRCDRP